MNRFDKLDGRSPFKRTVSGECPHCLRHTTLQVFSHTRLQGSEVLENGASVAARYFLLLRCDWCNKDSGYNRYASIEHGSQGGSTYELHATITLKPLWPEQTPRSLAPEAPDVVREVYSEAALAEAAGAFRLAGVGYRSAVEQIVKDRGATGKNLYDRISNLTSLGVAPETVDAFHEARVVGNDAVHDALAYSAEEIADIAELIDEAVLVLYVQPAQRAKMAQQRAARRAAAKQSAPPAPPAI